MVQPVRAVQVVAQEALWAAQAVERAGPMADQTRRDQVVDRGT